MGRNTPTSNKCAKNQGSSIPGRQRAFHRFPQLPQQGALLASEFLVKRRPRKELSRITTWLVVWLAGRHTGARRGRRGKKELLDELNLALQPSRTNQNACPTQSCRPFVPSAPRLFGPCASNSCRITCAGAVAPGVDVRSGGWEKPNWQKAGRMLSKSRSRMLVWPRSWPRRELHKSMNMYEPHCLNPWHEPRVYGLNTR